MSIGLSKLLKARSYRAVANVVRRGYRFGQLQHIPFFSGVGDSAWVIYGLVRALKPAVCVEIGSARGKSACFIAQALQENDKGKLYAIDPHNVNAWNDVGSEDTFGVMSGNLRKLNLSHRVEIVRKTSTVAAVEWNVPIDLLFIDGDHTYEGVRNDWDLFSPHLTKFGVALFHDTIWEVAEVDEQFRRKNMGVPSFVEELRRAGFPVITLPRDCGLSMVQKAAGGVPLKKDEG